MNLKSISLLFVSAALTLSVANAQESLLSLSVSNGKVFENFRGKKIASNVSSETLTKVLGLSNDHSFVVSHEITDKLGINHRNFQQYYKGVIVPGAMIMVHSKGGFIQSINGKTVYINGLNTSTSIDEERATAIAQEAMGIVTVARNYAPEFVIIEHPQTKEPIYAVAMRVDGRNNEGIIVMQKAFIDAQSGRLIEMEAVNAHTDVVGVGHTLLSGPREITTDFDGVSTYRLYDNARKIHTLNVGGIEPSWNPSNLFPNPIEYTNNSTDWTAQLAIIRTRLTTTSQTGIFSNLSNTRRPFGAILKTDALTTTQTTSAWPSISSSNSLVLNARGFYNFIKPGETYQGVFGKINLNNGNISDSFTFPIDTLEAGTFNWADTSGNSGLYVIDSINNPALDVHWGIAKTYDYYVEKFSRSSFDGDGTRIVNYVDGIFPMAGTNSNAMAMQSPYNAMIYGLGDGLMTNAFVSLDVTGHEYTHLVISRNGTNGLRYQGESGALNESFADIFGVSIDFYAHDTTANWLMGEEIYVGNNFMRSMAEPKLRNNPDTYKGQYWMNTENVNVDNGGVHYNSGVQNYWYYLVVEGGSGVNDNGYAYNVTGIGMEKAEQIAYRNLMHYLTYSATYNDAYQGSLQAVIDLYGNDTTSAEYVTVKNAWYAVGLGEGDATSLKDVKYTNDKVQVYPNPAMGSVFNIKSDLTNDVKATVYNSLGQSVKQLTLKKGTNTVDISGLPKGMYNISFNVEGKQYVHKVTIL